MIRSMTGFGRASFQVEELAFDVEVRSVNHRYLDARVRMPRLLAGFEPDVRGRIQQRFARGKLDLSVATPGGDALPARLEIDLEAARQYLDAAARLGRERDVTGELQVGTLLTLPGVSRFAEPEVSAAELERGLAGAVDAALEALDAMRASEGVALERDLLAHLSRVAELADSLEQRSDAVRDSVRERLQRRAEQLAREAGPVDEARLRQEIVLAADRMDVSEEIARLRSHVDQFRKIVGAGDAGKPVGRRLDFLLQEFGREANTIASKGSDAPIAHQVVELKTEIERLREQVQNVE